jgi:hypothetical protein
LYISKSGVLQEKKEKEKRERRNATVRRVQDLGRILSHGLELELMRTRKLEPANLLGRKIRAFPTEPTDRSAKEAIKLAR